MGFSYVVLHDDDTACLRAANGLRVKFRLTKLDHCHRAHLYLRHRAELTAKELTSSTTTLQSSKSTSEQEFASTTTTTTIHQPTAIHTSTRTTKATTTMTTSTTPTTPLTTTTVTLAIPIGRPVRAVQTMDTTQEPPPPPSPPPTTTASSQRTTFPTTTIPTISSPLPSYEQLNARAWRNIIRSYTIVDRMERMYHNLSMPLQQYLQASPLTTLINNGSYLEKRLEPRN